MNLQDNSNNSNYNIWIEASAGTGKTTKLVARYISLLISGVKIPHILCVTYTNNAANEIKERISDKLAELAKQDPDQYFQVYSYFLNNQQLANIGTLHSFCLQLVQQFHQELNKPPAFSIINDNDLKHKLRQNFDKWLLLADSQYDQQLKQDLANNFSEEGLFSKIKFMADNILRVNEMLKLSEQEYYQGLKQLLAIPPSAKYIDVEQQHNGQNLLTANNTIRKSLYKITDENLRQELISRAEQLQLNAKINILEKNLIIFRAFIASYKYYQQENSKTNHLDYNDIIALCQELFSGHDLGWVGFKLNQQISHILLDEAQDTSPKQWQIIDKLYGFAYETISDASSVIEQQTLLPTLFIVGDYKQSIYSFQGAKPEYYQSRLAHFQQAYPLVNWHVEQLDQCYRCPKQILDFCNQLFLESNKQITSYRPHTSQSAIIGNVREVNITKEQYDNDNLLELIAVDLTQPTFILAKKWATAHDVYNEDEVDVYQLRNAMLMNHRLDSLGRFIKDVFLSASNNCYDADLEQRVILRKKFLLSQALQSNQHYKKYIADNYSKKYPAPFNNNIISMTMHGAKGLERQNVYVILQAKAKARPNAMLIDEVNNIYVNREGREFIPYITDLTMMEKTQAKAEDNRLLYVALTRSKQNLTVVNITN